MCVVPLLVGMVCPKTISGRTGQTGGLDADGTDGLKVNVAGVCIRSTLIVNHLVQENSEGSDAG